MTIGAIFTAIARALGLIQQRDSEKNAPDVKAAAVAQNEVNAQDGIKTHIANKDVTATRQDIAE